MVEAGILQFQELISELMSFRKGNTCTTPNHLLLDTAPNLGPLISPWEINKFENC